MSVAINTSKFNPRKVLPKFELEQPQNLPIQTADDLKLKEVVRSKLETVDLNVIDESVAEIMRNTKERMSINGDEISETKSENEEEEKEDDDDIDDFRKKDIEEKQPIQTSLPPFQASFQNPQINHPVQQTSPIQFIQSATPKNPIMIKQGLIFKINRYINSKIFGKLISDHGLNYDSHILENLSIEQLENMLAKIRIVVMYRSTDKMYDNMLVSFCSVTENLVSKVYNIRGFSQILLNSEDFKSCWEEVKLEAEVPYISPKARLLFMSLQTMIIANTLQSANFNMQDKNDEVQNKSQKIERKEENDKNVI